MSTVRLLYEQSTVHRGYLIIPFQYGVVAGVTLYSYRLLSLVDSQAPFHRAENPCDRFAEDPIRIIELAKEHLDNCLSDVQQPDYIQQHYIYRQNLIIISAIGEKVFYDHYPPDSLRNIAAPRIFSSEQECMDWIKQGLDQRSSTSAS